MSYIFKALFNIGDEVISVNSLTAGTIKEIVFNVYSVTYGVITKEYSSLYYYDEKYLQLKPKEDIVVYTTVKDLSVENLEFVFRIPISFANRFRGNDDNVKITYTHDKKFKGIEML